MDTNEIVVIGEVTKDQIMFPADPGTGFQLFCEAGCVDGIFTGIAFQVIKKNGVDVPGTFTQEPWGFSTDYEGDDLSELEEVLDEFRTEMGGRYYIEWEDKPVPPESEPVEEEPVEGEAAQESANEEE